ncbi:protein kinase [Kitasatospora sp. NPDC089797]|uniref:serine/threonine-protein kinase n=1 Tax=Kitasatospora sp. NPDC089797 TaxID=3155298 RepID=UPI00341283EB
MQPGEVLDGRYELVEQIGEGAFGAVWKARDARIRRLVAVKVLLPGGTGSAKDAARFAREVATAGALNHPSIVTVHDFGRHLGAERPLFFLVMELLDGAPLSRHLADGPPPLPRALDWAAQIAGALGTAHRAGVVHRDVKPANVMVQSGGTVKVVDFGIARTGTADDGVTSTNVIVGTPAYMAPERFDSRVLDARSDLYAFGCLLYELLTGRPPFRGTLFELIRQHGETRPAAPSSLRAGSPGPAGAPALPALPALPAELDALVLELLAKDPADRPADAQSVAERLRRFAERPDLSERPGRPGHHPATVPNAPAHTTAEQDAYVLARRREADALLARAREEATRRQERFDTEAARLRHRAEQEVAELKALTEAAAQQIIADARARGEQLERESAARAAASLRQLSESEQRNDLLSRQTEKLRSDAEHLRRSVDNARRQASEFLADAVAKAGLGPAPEPRPQPAGPPAPSGPQRRSLSGMRELLSGRGRSAERGPQGAEDGPRRRE